MNGFQPLGANPETLALLLETTGAVGATYQGGAFTVGINESLDAGTSFTVGVTTEDLQIVLDAPVINSNSGNVKFVIREDAVFTGGTPLTAFITDFNSSLTPGVSVLVKDPTVSVVGTDVTPVIEFIGDSSSGRSDNYSFGIPYILKPLTNYILEVTHDGGQTREVNLYISAHRRRT